MYEYTQDDSDFIARNARALRRMIAKTPGMHCYRHRMHRYHQCDFCSDLQDDVSMRAARKRAKYLDKHPDGIRCEEAWLKSRVTSLVSDSIRSQRKALGVGCRPERAVRWLDEGVLGGDERNIKLIRQLRWWAGPQPVAVEKTPVPYLYLAGRLDEPCTPEFADYVDGILEMLIRANPDWFYANIGSAILRRLDENGVSTVELIAA